MHLQIEEQDAQFHFRQLKFDFWTIWKNFINTIRHFFRWGSPTFSFYSLRDDISYQIYVPGKLGSWFISDANYPNIV